MKSVEAGSPPYCGILLRVIPPHEPKSIGNQLVPRSATCHRPFLDYHLLVLAIMMVMTVNGRGGWVPGLVNVLVCDPQFSSCLVLVPGCWYPSRHPQESWQISLTVQIAQVMMGAAGIETA